MIKANGKIQKKTYCSHCFSIITWDTVDDEQSTMGHRSVICPYCKTKEDIDDSVEIIETGVIEEPKAYINNVAYATTAEALSALQDGDSISLLEDVTIPSLSVSNADIDLNGHTITVTNSILPKGNSVLSNGSIVTSQATDSLIIRDKAEVTLNNMNITSKRNGISTSNGGKLILNDSNVKAQEAAIFVGGNGTVEINGGEYETIDNGVIMTNGLSGRGSNTIIVNGGDFVGKITSAGYLAHIVYLANEDNLIVKGGNFTVENGSAFVVRGGSLKIDPSVVINASGTVSGKVGDASQPVPAGHDIVVDYKSNYPAVKSIKVDAQGKDIFTIEAEA